MYDRRLNGQTLSFGHAGILYKKSFVMYDRQTESLWVHVTGKAEVGPLKGQQLQFIPSTVTTWAQWKAAHPQSLVLPGYRRGGFMGTYTGVKRIRPFGLAVFSNFKAKLYRFRDLKRQQVVNDTFRDAELMVAFLEDTNTAMAWKRRLNGQLLTFAWADAAQNGPPLLTDKETGSLWSPMTGTAFSGQLKGQQLDPLQHYPILVNRFHAFYPEGEVFK
ncbi:hypothetical protein C2W62_05870 [Candidatus Entotheonella serta]|nr:hypothetical protein C2W62_05870 [Candidatus Entotheonella serta]